MKQHYFLEQLSCKTYFELFQLINFINSPNKEKCLNFYNIYKNRIDYVKGSKSKHQAWNGGYKQHIEETMNIGMQLFNVLHCLRQLDFTISDILLVLFLHDIEKIWIYSNKNTKNIVFPKNIREEFKKIVIENFEFELTDKQKIALQYIEGENQHYGDSKLMNDLGTICHCADIISARLWHNYPQSDDSWIKHKFINKRSNNSK